MVTRVVSSFDQPPLLRVSDPLSSDKIAPESDKCRSNSSRDSSSEPNAAMVIKPDTMVGPEMGKTTSCCCSSSTTTRRQPPRKTRSGSILDKLMLGNRRRRRSPRSGSEKTLECQTQSEEFSACSSIGVGQSRIAGGCLKVPTQAQSLLRSLSSSATETESEVEEQPQGQRGVSFGSIDLLVFPVALGDNPSVSVGPPVCLGSQLYCRLNVSVDDYESTRPPIRARENLHIPKMVREDWLRDEGYSRGECREVEEMLLAIKKSRKASASSGLDSKFFLRLFSSKAQKKRPSATLKVDK